MFFYAWLLAGCLPANSRDFQKVENFFLFLIKLFLVVLVTYEHHLGSKNIIFYDGDIIIVISFIRKTLELMKVLRLLGN